MALPNIDDTVILCLLYVKKMRRVAWVTVYLAANIAWFV